MVSMTYTLGTQWMDPTTRFCSYLIQGIENYSEVEVVNAIATWCHSGNDPLDHLVERRLTEAYLFLYGEYENDGPDNYRYIHFDPNGGDVEHKTIFYPVDEVYGELPTPTGNGGRTFLGLSLIHIWGDITPWVEAYRRDCVTIGKEVRLLWSENQERALALDVDGQFGLVVRREEMCIRDSPGPGGQDPGSQQYLYLLAHPHAGVPPGHPGGDGAVLRPGPGGVRCHLHDRWLHSWSNCYDFYHRLPALADGRRRPGFPLGAGECGHLGGGTAGGEHVGAAGEAVRPKGGAVNGAGGTGGEDLRRFPPKSGVSGRGRARCV